MVLQQRLTFWWGGSHFEEAASNTPTKAHVSVEGDTAHTTHEKMPRHHSFSSCSGVNGSLGTRLFAHVREESGTETMSMVELHSLCTYTLLRQLLHSRIKSTTSPCKARVFITENRQTWLAVLSKVTLYSRNNLHQGGWGVWDFVLATSFHYESR